MCVCVHCAQLIHADSCVKNKIKMFVEARKNRCQTIRRFMSTEIDPIKYLTLCCETRAHPPPPPTHTHPGAIARYSNEYFIWNLIRMETNEVPRQ